MAHRSSADFNQQLAAAFADYGTTLSGYVRYQLTRRNLEPFIKDKKLAVLDVGGGSGGDTAWLAEKGHRVTYLEPSEEQRRYAQRRFSFLLDEKVRTRIDMTASSLEDLATDKYDLVLVHTVGMYQQDAATFLRTALQFVKPGGLVSMIEKGYYGTELFDVRTGNFADLKRVRRTGRSINSLHMNVQAFKPEELEQLLADEGFKIEEWSGIRLLTDDFSAPADSIDPKRLKIILQLEYEHGHHPAIRGDGQLLHFIARKRGA